MKISAIISILLILLSCNNKKNTKSAQPFGVSKDTLKIVSTDKIEAFKEAENNDCVFDTSTYKFTTQALMKYKSNIKFTWDDIEKEAKTVFDNGDTLFLHIGGCDHFSYAATLITDLPFTETKTLTEKSRWLAKTFFNDGFDSKYDSCISKGLYKETEALDKENSKTFEIIDPDTTMTNMIYEGFQFWRLNNKTKIVISGYIN